MPHYYDAKQEGAFRPYEIIVRARGRTLKLWSASGVFSKDRLDAGTRLLLEECTLVPGWHVHDLGCGNGVVALFAMLTVPGVRVVASDVNERAVTLAKRNVGLYAPAVTVLLSDGYANVHDVFDTVLFNPPYVAGRQEILRLVRDAKAHLRPGGLLQLVARHTKGGATLKEHLVALFGNCDDSRRSGGFRLYVCKNNA